MESKTLHDASRALRQLAVVRDVRPVAHHRGTGEATALQNIHAVGDAQSARQDRLSRGGGCNLGGGGCRFRHCGLLCLCLLFFEFFAFLDFFLFAHLQCLLGLYLRLVLLGFDFCDGLLDKDVGAV